MPETKPKQQLVNLRARQQLLYILIFSFVTVAVWVGASLIFSQRRTGISPELQEMAKPLTPTINTTVIDEMEQKRFYSTQELNDFTIYRLVKSKDGRTQRIITLDDNVDEVLARESAPVSAAGSAVTQEGLLEGTSPAPTATSFETAPEASPIPSPATDLQ